MNNKISGIKRKFDQISDNNTLNDTISSIAKRIFLNIYQDQYDELNLSLYPIDKIVDSRFPNTIINPDFIRDDGFIIYIQIYNNGICIKQVNEEIIQITMDILEPKNTILFTFYLESSSDVLMNDSYDINKIEYVNYCYDINFISNLLNTPNKKIKLSEDTTKQEINIDSDMDDDVDIFRPNEWISASKTRNYALHNTLIDWLDLWYDNNYKSKKSNVNFTNEDNFNNFLMNRGISFETNVINLIKLKIPENEFITICSDMNNFYNKILEYEKKTINEIKKGTPIIYQSVLLNRSGRLKYSYGIPDLLVRSDYLNKIIKLSPLSEEMINYRAPKLKKYHYVIVDIKFATLELCSDGKRIRNSGSFPAYKCQLFIYNKALGKIQGYEPPNAYILGRKYKFESRGKIFMENDCFARFGHIEYDGWDFKYIDETIKAIEWIKNLRKYGKEWILLPKPSVPQLYPNMSNDNNNKWDNIKYEYANKLGEITLLWNCGIKNREIAHKNGIYSYRDPKCTAEYLGINGPKKKVLLNEIIKINRETNFKSSLEKISISINNNINNRWLDNVILRITVDFEIINNVFDDFKGLPMAYDDNYLFMIGISYKINNNKPEYKMFLISELTYDAEFQLLYQFYHFLRQLTDEYLGVDVAIPPLYHWGHIEKSFFNDLCNKLKKNIGHDEISNDIDSIKDNLEWVDLSDYFRENLIVINGCFKFGLKEIGKRFYELGLVETTWKNDNMDGNTAMMMAYKAYKISLEQSIPINKIKIMSDIMEYNKVDCIIIHEIIDIIKMKININ